MNADFKLYHYPIFGSDILRIYYATTRFLVVLEQLDIGSLLDRIHERTLSRKPGLAGPAWCKDSCIKLDESEVNENLDFAALPSYVSTDSKLKSPIALNNPAPRPDERVFHFLRLAAR
jgi:hypothetical protein